ncbi:MAG: N-acetylmuramoyl-L-alanine amidase [Alphaproteobacteria bacterium]
MLTIRTADQKNDITRIVFDVTDKKEILFSLTSQALEISHMGPETAFKNQSQQIGAKQTQGHKTLFILKTPLQLHHSFWIPPSAQIPFYRYIIDLKKTTTPVFAAPPATTIPEKKKIIIDAGHGGRDPGTIGIGKTQEKDVTFAVAKRLAHKLNQTGRYHAILIRQSDTSITLADRLKKARSLKGDLFLSLHADSCDGPDTRGLSLYTLSAVASDKQAARLAKKENKADLIMGVDLQSELPEVAHILIDLTKRETMNLSTHMADCLLKKLRDRVFLLRKPHRFADFFILKSADLPSVLIELGYLSNPKEAALLVTTEHQENICMGIVEAIDDYFKPRHQ